MTPHRLRHSFASELEAAGAGLVLIQELLGHRQITSSQVYVQPGAAALRAAVERAYGRTRAIADAVREEEATVAGAELAPVIPLRAPVSGEDELSGCAGRWICRG